MYVPLLQIFAFSCFSSVHLRHSCPIAKIPRERLLICSVSVFSSHGTASMGSQMLDNLAFNDTWYPVALVSGVAFFLWIVNVSIASRPMV